MNNNDLISVDGFVRWLDVGKYRNANEKCFSERNVAAMIKDFALTDSVDAAPVVHARWVPIINTWTQDEHEYGQRWYKCSKCGREYDSTAPYCRCGAKMDEECDAK